MEAGNPWVGKIPNGPAKENGIPKWIAKRLHFFNLRYEIREEIVRNPETIAEDPEVVALREAELFLRTLRITHGPFRAAVMDMTAMVKRG